MKAKPANRRRSDEARATQSGDPVGPLVCCIGDLHGHYPALQSILDSLRSKYHLFQPSDPDRLRRGVKLVFTGDYIDRGDDALGIINRLRRLDERNPRQVITLLGNHELMALECYDDAVELLGRVGYWTGRRRPHAPQPWGHGQPTLDVPLPQACCGFKPATGVASRPCAFRSWSR